MNSIDVLTVLLSVVGVVAVTELRDVAFSSDSPN